MGLRAPRRGHAASLSDRVAMSDVAVGAEGSRGATGGPSLKDEENDGVHLGLGVGAGVRQQEGSSEGAGNQRGRGGSPAGDLLAGETGAAGNSAAPALLTEGERKAFRMGVLAAGGIYIDASRFGCGCRQRLENLRISIAARGVECEAPGVWPVRGGP